MSRSRAWQFTPAAERTVEQCRRWSRAAGLTEDWSGVLVLSLLGDESLASACLRDCGIAVSDLGALLPQGLVSGCGVGVVVAEGWTGAAVESVGSDCSLQRSLTDVADPDNFLRLLERAREIARRETADGSITSAALLLAVFQHSPQLQSVFGVRGVSAEQLQGRLFPREQPERLVLEAGELVFGDVVTGADVVVGAAGQLAGESVSERVAGAGVDGAGVLRVLDAALNRAREGLRVLEDYGRFVGNNAEAALQLKSLRHELCQAESGVPCLRAGSRERLAVRDTVGDVGAGITVPTEQHRADACGVLVANLRRVQESLRSLEEFGKLLDVSFASTMKRLRYRTYVVEQLLVGAGKSESDTVRGRLQRARLYVLITESQCRQSWRDVVRLVLEGGADVLQLREKHLGDRELLRRAEWVSGACAEAGALFVMNDRPDLAVLSGAVGVHVGQEELGGGACRRIVGAAGLVGISTHGVLQFREAIAVGADYAGVGPVFPSTTKQFAEFPGLDYVTAVAELCAAEAVDFPWFAIGGITEERLGLVRAAGAGRVAVGAAVTASEDPRGVAERFSLALRTES
jgi:thiamine-phosphate pyrophosphorylase